jgi:hypothetical protein
MAWLGTLRASATIGASPVVLVGIAAIVAAGVALAVGVRLPGAPAARPSGG